MNNITQNIFKQALGLAPVERAELIEELFRSLNNLNIGKQTDALWSEEAESRIAGYDAGKITAHSATEVLTRIKQR